MRIYVMSVVMGALAVSFLGAATKPPLQSEGRSLGRLTELARGIQGRGGCPLYSLEASHRAVPKFMDLFLKVSSAAQEKCFSRHRAVFFHLATLCVYMPEKRERIAVLRFFCRIERSMSREVLVAYIRDLTRQASSESLMVLIMFQECILGLKESDRVQKEGRDFLNLLLEELNASRPGMPVGPVFFASAPGGTDADVMSDDEVLRSLSTDSPDCPGCAVGDFDDSWCFEA